MNAETVINHEPSIGIRRLKRTKNLLLALAVVSLMSLLAPPPLVGAADNPAMCNTSVVRTNFLNNVLSSDRTGTDGWTAFLSDLDDTDLLYLCSMDQFYLAPTSLPSQPTGTILRIRPVYPSYGGPDTFTLKIMYLTEDRNEQVVATTGTIIMNRQFPSGTPDRALIVSNHGTAGIAATCVDYADLATATLRDVSMRPFLENYDAVWAQPDYIGFGSPVPGQRYHTYMVADDQAHAALDMAKAVKSIDGLTGMGAGWALTGHSQGGQTSLLAAERNDTYGSSALDLKAALAVAPAGSLVPLADDFDGPNKLFMWMAALGMATSYPSLNLSEIFKPASLDSIHLLFDNGADAELMYFLATGNLPLRTPDQLIAELYWEDLDGRNYDWTANLNFSGVRGSRRLVGCEYNSVAAVTNWIVANSVGGTPYVAGYELSDTWDEIINDVLPENSVGPISADTPIGFMMGDCDGLFPITNPKLPACGGPTPSGSPPPPNTLRPGYVTGPGFNAFVDLCALGYEVTGRIYGEIDWNIDGLVDDPSQIEPGPVKHFDHSTVMTKYPDGIAWIEAAFNNLTSSNC